MRHKINELKQMLENEFEESFPFIEEKMEYKDNPLLDENIAGYIDHTILKIETTEKDIERTAGEAVEHGFYSVCIPPVYVPQASQLLRGTPVKVCTVIGFPHGYSITKAKTIEAANAVQSGAAEVDMVLNIGWLRSQNWKAVREDIEKVVLAVKGEGLVKVILETSVLTQEEKIIACLLAQWSKADYVKTSTGFGHGGAVVEDVQLMKEVVGDTMGIKASGGIRNYETASKMLRAGANRLGTSASVIIRTGPTYTTGPTCT